nr:MAG TPA: hypothetical protein [Caudoviricetes sp.]
MNDLCFGNTSCTFKFLFLHNLKSGIWSSIYPLLCCQFS